ncbi:hypothetical protein HRU45_01055, partial [Candidatus Dependentiae bacterium]|nr:hypothetical protein [Candidatus Dependentiae bacterium]
MTTPKSFLCYCLTFSSTAYSAAAKVKPEALQIGVNFMLGKNTKKNANKDHFMQKNILIIFATLFIINGIVVEASHAQLRPKIENQKELNQKLFDAAEHGSLEDFNGWLNRGAQLTAQNNNGGQPIHWAVCK